MRGLINSVLVVVLLCLWSTNGAAKDGANDATEYVEKVQAFYADAKTFTASFTQVVKNKTFGRESTSSGKVFFMKPGRMRWDYESKKKRKKITKSFLSDGKTLWAVFPSEHEYYKGSLKNVALPVAISFLGGQGNLTASFDVALAKNSGLGDDGDPVLRLTPKKTTARYTTLWLVLDPEDFHVKKSVVLNAQGDTNAFSFATPTLGKRLKKSIFVFDAKKNPKYKLIQPAKSP